jgi:putative sterol carrier protein
VVTLTFQALKKDATRGAELGLQRLVARSSDQQIERVAGSSLGLKAIFKTMQSRYVPANAKGFNGQIQYDLKYEDGRITTWSLALDSRRAKATNAPAVDPALTISSTIADFVRMGAGDLAPAKALLTGRIDISGDLVIAARMGEMFGQDSPF